ncbi:NADP-dependent 3-hydroxyisobutyrate dehydrogenase-like protein [Mycetohabitans endofungorum]|uniref:NADP-dependent 3-hydroxyisobutyrate dehydrogenase-like protein n=1 Tax=Mycetohabitans endofungorum TaxID=417203 RepID=A0A2P5KB82_9BURK|nr:NADP-dependent 3-hydroxyisobutyrate dehydrogenase-like protein [Mycetohabitans endofungorum]
MMGVAEAMSLGVSLGIDPAVLAGIISTSTGRCWSSDTYNPYPGVLPNAPAACGYSGGFATVLMLKDLGLATEAVRHAKQPGWLDGKYLSDSITSWASRRLHTPAPVTIDCRAPFPGCRMSCH